MRLEMSWFLSLELCWGFFDKDDFLSTWFCLIEKEESLSIVVLLVTRPYQGTWDPLSAFLLTIDLITVFPFLCGDYPAEL